MTRGLRSSERRSWLGGGSRPAAPPRRGLAPPSSLSLSSLELSETTIYKPQLRALHETASHFCLVVVRSWLGGGSRPAAPPRRGLAPPPARLGQSWPRIRQSRPRIRQSRPGSGTKNTVMARFWHQQDSHGQMLLDSGTDKTAKARLWHK